MNNKNFFQYSVILGVLLLVAAVSCYYIFTFTYGKYKNPDMLVPQPTTQAVTGLMFIDSEYGFVLSLPKGWEGYTATRTDIEFGKEVIIRKPLAANATSAAAFIPILIYKLEQWTAWEASNFEGYPTAAPMGPTERGRNANYVFATAPRYNFSFFPGFEEVEEIIKNLKAY